jgi:hypothetical protein
VNKLIALFLTFLLLSSQIGFAVSTHFCGGKVSERAFSLTTSDVGCGMETATSSCSADLVNSISQKSCCDDESEVFQLRENFNKKQSTVDVKLNFLKVFLATALLLFETQKEEVGFANLPPTPIIRQNSQVLFQTFLL